MKASTTYNDLIGTSGANISNLNTKFNKLEELADYFKIDKKRFKAVGLSIYGPSNDYEEFCVKFICVDKQKSTEEKEHIVQILIDDEYDNILGLLFETLHIVLYDQFDSKYPELNYDEETFLSKYKND